MIKISKQNNSLIVEGIENVFYPNNGDNSYPLNSLIVVTDNSDMATFRSVATNDVLFSGLIKDITINGEAVTKDNIIEKFDAVSNSSTGGGGGGTVDAYTKEEADTKFASKDELANVQTVANDADTKVDALTPRVEGVETAMNDKQDLLVSGTNIKTINNQSILGEGNLEISGDVDLTNYYTKPEADGKFATVTGFNEQAADISALQTAMEGKQATLVSGENIKTINSESILGTGDIQINGVSEEQAQEIAKIPTLETELAQKANVSDIPTVQHGFQGTTKNYIYSSGDMITSNNSVVSNLENGRADANTLNVAIYEWGGSVSKILKLPSSTTTAAGVMSAVDKNKLDSIPENIPTQTEVDNIAANVSTLEAAMNGKQDTLVSGTNIKTINGNSILGEGNLVIEGGDVDLSNYYTKTETDTKLDTKQNTLVSGTNIKTINSQSILGEGNIEVSGVSEEQAQEIAKIPTLETELAQKANASDVPTVQTGSDGTNKNYIYSDPNTSSTKVISNVTLVREFDSIRMQKYYWIPDDSTSTNYVTDILSSATTSKAGVMSAADKTKLDSISNEWTGTQSEYDALTTKDNNTIYYVTE